MANPRAMLALVVALGAIGAFGFASLVLVGPGPKRAAPADAVPLRSVAVEPFVAKEGSPLAAAAETLSGDVARRLAASMPHVAIVAPGGVARFRLAGEVRGGDGDVVVTLRLTDDRSGRIAGAATVSVPPARLHEAGAQLEPAARRLAATAMLEAAAKD